MNKLYYFLLLLLAVMTYSTSATAQTTQASISGVISENKNTPLPGATVQVRNESTGFTTGTVTNLKGEYLFKELPLGGPYTVWATSVGFGEQRRTGYTVNQGDAIRVSLTMQEAGQDLEVVQVVASGLKNKTENLGAATAITAKTLTTMPVNGRNFTSLVNLSPLSASNGTLSGQLGSSTNFTIDGMTAKNPTSAGSTTSRSGAPYSISIEAVREFKVITNQYDVVYGRAGGGIVSAVTKAGTNKLTGSIFNYTRANWLSSKYDIRGNVRERTVLHQSVRFFTRWPDHQR